MTTYVALLRGIAPMNPNMRNEKLRSVFEGLGFKNVRPVISSGNIIFESSSKDPAALEATLEAAWPEKLGFSSTTIIRSLDELRDLVAKDPFSGLSHSPKTSLNVTFLKQPADTGVGLPGGKGYTVPAAYEREICAVIDTTTAKTPDYMRKAEQLYGKEITTRSWLTVLRLLKKCEG